MLIAIKIIEKPISWRACNREGAQNVKKTSKRQDVGGPDSSPFLLWQEVSFC